MMQKRRVRFCDDTELSTTTSGSSTSLSSLDSSESSCSESSSTPSTPIFEICVEKPVPRHILWYTPADYLQFRAQDNESQQNCLEVHLRRREFIQAILDLQHEQIIMGIGPDPKGLQVHSKACSKNATLRARQAAISIAKEIGHAVDEDNIKVSSLSFMKNNRSSPSCRSSTTTTRTRRLMRFSPTPSSAACPSA